jgi:MSHA biogenesis protein MshQ
MHFMNTQLPGFAKGWAAPGSPGVPGSWNSWICRGLAAVLMVFCWTSSVHAATYAYRNIGFAYDSPSGSAATVAWHSSGSSPGCTGYPDGDDDWSDIGFTGGFTFTFGGTNYSGVRVYSNGILAFGNDVSGFHRNYTPQALPITSAAGGAPSGCQNGVPVNLMLPYWIDIVAGTANSTSGASVKYEMLGTAPNRRVVISWNNVKLYNTSTRYNFQVVLYEGSAGVNNRFEYRYTSGSSNGSNATVGVQLNTTDYTQYSYNQTFIDTTNGTAILWYPANQLATKSAEYRFDEGVWIGVAGEVRDTSGNSQDAVRVGNASNVANGKLCRGGSFINNTSATTIDAVATPVIPGNVGSIDFWFNSNTKWNSGDAMLLDATAVANRPFFLMNRSSGALRFAVADNSGTTLTAETGSLTYAAGTWHHIGVTWSIRTGTNQSLVQIIIDGNLIASTRGTTNGTLPALSSIYIGDNRTSGVTPSNGTPNGANGIIDEFYVYDIDVSLPQFQADMALTRSVCSAIDHFEIIHNGTASCGSAQVTIQAHDASHNLISLAGSTMTVSSSTNHGTWSTVSAINSITNTTPGKATYTFANESSVVLGLSNPFVETLNINVSLGTITEHSGAAASCVTKDYTFGSTCDADLVFGSCVGSYECLATGQAYNNLTSNPSSRNPLYTKLAGTAFAFDVAALDTSGNIVTNYASDADKAVTVELVNASGAGTCSSLPALSPATSSALTFTKVNQPTDQGRKAVTFTVAKAYPNLRCRVTDTNVTPSVVACSSDNFAIRPGAVTISTNATATPPSATATPTIAAGSSFLVTATTSTSANDAYAGTLTLDTGKLTAQITGQDTAIASGGTVGSLSLLSMVANQTPATGNATYSEVGYLYLASGALRDDSFTAVDSATGDCVTTTTGNLYLADNADASGKFGCSIGNRTTASFGRFRPYAFDTTVTNACVAGGFTYSGQSFPLAVTAKNAFGGVTANYSGSFANALNYSDANGASGTFNPTTLAAASFTNGVADLTATPSVSFTFGAKLSTPATLKLRVSETAGASSSLGTEGTTALRSGQLRLFNAFGSEKSNLAMPVQVQYWSGQSWVINSGDSCTVIPANAIYLSGVPTGVTASGFALASGNATLTLAKPNPVATGSVDAAIDLGALGSDQSCLATHGGTAADLPWLRSRNGTCAATYDRDPSARATFGINPSESTKSIHIRELY